MAPLRAASGPRSAPARGNAARTRQSILDGAFDALVEGGLPNLSFDRIARASGTSRQLVRYHFPDADTLMIELCDRLAATYRDALLEGIASLPPDAPRLGVFLDFYFDVLEGRRKPKDEQVYDALMSRAAGSAKVRDRLRDQYSLLGQIVTNELVLAHPSLEAERASEISWLFVALVYGHWRLVSTLGFSPSHRKVTREAVDRLIASYLSDPGTPRGVKVWETESTA